MKCIKVKWKSFVQSFESFVMAFSFTQTSQCWLLLQEIEICTFCNFSMKCAKKKLYHEFAGWKRYEIWERIALSIKQFIKYQYSCLIIWKVDIQNYKSILKWNKREAFFSCNSRKLQSNVNVYIYSFKIRPSNLFIYSSWHMNVVNIFFSTYIPISIRFSTIILWK